MKNLNEMVEPVEGKKGTCPECDFLILDDTYNPCTPIEPNSQIDTICPSCKIKLVHCSNKYGEEWIGYPN